MCHIPFLQTIWYLHTSMRVDLSSTLFQIEIIGNMRSHHFTINHMLYVQYKACYFYYPVNTRSYHLKLDKSGAMYFVNI